MKPKIGLTPFVNGDDEQLSVRYSYVNAVIKSGGIPVILPLTDDYSILDMICEYIDGIIFTGGHDINSIYYKKDKYDDSINNDVDMRDKNELHLLRKFVKLDKPVLGICRGCQLINVFDGGALYKDIPTELGSSVIHEQCKPYDKISHEVLLSKESRLYNEVKSENLFVNSIHHQGIKLLGNNLKSVAKACDGLVEAVEMLNARFVMGVQWHPEWLYEYDYASRCIFKMFIDSCYKK